MLDVILPAVVVSNEAYGSVRNTELFSKNRLNIVKQSAAEKVVLTSGQRVMLTRLAPHER